MRKIPKGIILCSFSKIAQKEFIWGYINIETPNELSCVCVKKRPNELSAVYNVCLPVENNKM